jgi:hypothetical protein
MNFTISKAERKQILLRIALISPSGGGKTYSALRLAKGIGLKTGVIDTENRRSLYYADEFNFEHIPFNPPFSPENYIAAMDFAIANGCKTIILDSGSHEWIGTGGILSIKDSMPPSQFKNEWAKWERLTPRHNAFIDKIQRCDAHIIVCLRGKDEYVLEQNEKGKTAPKKVGVGAQMRDGLEYECTVALMIDQESHHFSVTKDNTHLFDGRFDLITEKDGAALLEWAQKGTLAAPDPKAECSEVMISEEQALTISMEVQRREGAELGSIRRFYAGVLGKKEINDVTEIPAKYYEQIMGQLQKKALRQV